MRGKWARITHMVREAAYFKQKRIPPIGDLVECVRQDPAAGSIFHSGGARARFERSGEHDSFTCNP